MRNPVNASAASFLLCAALAVPAARADEGMWPYNLFPADAVGAAHGVTISPALLHTAMQASVRFNNGGSGAFVSRNGLVMTNHHVAQDCITKLASGLQGPDLMKEGFVAHTRAEELRCPDLELNRLIDIVDVSAEVEAAAAAATDDATKNTARKAAMARIERACAERTGNRCDVVTLYGGGVSHLYRYQKFVDVRLVFAPEFAIAFFGGDAENFTYPREDLDAAFFRVYAGDNPVEAPAFLPLSSAGPKDGELVFVSGHPGSTDRLAVTAKLELLRDVTYPLILQQYEKQRAMLARYRQTSDAAERAARKDFFSTENTLKAITGFLRGLKDPALMQEAKRRQDELVVKVNTLPSATRERFLSAWPKLEAAFHAARTLTPAHLVLEKNLGPGGQAFADARHFVRLAAELGKPSDQRLREYRDSNLPSVELELLSSAPLDESYAVERVAFGLTAMQDVLGKSHPAVRAALAGMSPRARAVAAVHGSGVLDLAWRAALLQQLKAGAGEAALTAAHDPLLALAATLDPFARTARQQIEDTVESAEREYAGRIAEAYGLVYGNAVYPDATFTLRVSTGVVAAVPGPNPAPWRTTFGDLYVKAKRHAGLPGYVLPPRFVEAMPRVDFTVPFNFVSTNDIIGGNSGSPTFNAAGEVVGLIFDSNLDGLPNRFLYRSERARAVSVSSTAILHALDRVYGAPELARELVQRAPDR